MTIPTLSTPDGTTIPAIGFGTYRLGGEEGADSIARAIDAGYRLVDSAFSYENEGAVGAAVRRADVPRDDVIVTSKLPGRHQAHDDAVRTVEESLFRTGLDRIDLYLIHWPNPRVGTYVEAYEALVECRERGLIRHVGVSNFLPEHLDRIIDATGVAPAVNQVELHPYFPQTELRAVHQRLGIVTESWSPLAKQSELLTEQPVTAAAAAHGVSAGQVVLRWHVQLGAVPVPKSGDADRQRENLDVFGFTLSDDEVQAISALERGRLWDGDPDTHEEM